MGLRSDCNNYYRVFDPCLDFSFIPCEEKKLCQFWCILTVLPPIRIGGGLPPIRTETPTPPPLDHDWRKGPARKPI